MCFAFLPLCLRPFNLRPLLHFIFFLKMDRYFCVTAVDYHAINSFLLILCVHFFGLPNIVYYFPKLQPGCVAQSVGHLTRKSGVLGSIPGLATYFRFSFRLLFQERAVVSYWRKYVHEVLVNRLGGLSLPRKSVVRLNDRPDMTLDVYRGRKTTIQQQQQPKLHIIQLICVNEIYSHRFIPI